MNIRSSQVWLTSTIAALSLLQVPGSFAAETAPAAGEPVSPAPSASATVEATTPVVTGTVSANTSAQTKLPYGVEDVVKLSRSQISEDVILSYVQNSGTIYNLAPKDLVYLKEAGVSDRVVNAMQDQRKRANEAAALIASQQPLYQDNTPVNTAPAYTDSAPEYTQPAEAQPAPSTLYVIPYTPSVYSYYGYPYYYRPYYGGYYGGFYRFHGASVYARVGNAGHSHGHSSVHVVHHR